MKGIYPRYLHRLIIIFLSEFFFYWKEKKENIFNGIRNVCKHLFSIRNSLSIPRIIFQSYHPGNSISLAMQNHHRLFFIFRAFQILKLLNERLVGNPEIFMNIEQCKKMCRINTLEQTTYVVKW